MKDETCGFDSLQERYNFIRAQELAAFLEEDPNSDLVKCLVDALINFEKALKKDRHG